MSMQPISALPDRSRLWVFPSSRPLSGADKQALSRAVEEGLQDWSAHGSPITWGHEILEDRFLLIAVDEADAALTGCSIDNATRKLQSLEQELDMVLLDSGRVIFKDRDAVRIASRTDFKEKALNGEVDGDTLVYDTVVQTLGELRDGRWLVRAKDSWHARAFPLAS